MPALFDNRIRAMRRDRAAHIGGDRFLYERAFEDCFERILLTNRRYSSALLVGCPDADWPGRLRATADAVEVRDPGLVFATRAGGEPITEDHWHPPEAAYDLILAIGTLDSVNDLPLALRLLRHAAAPDALFIGAHSGGQTLPQLRAAMRAADSVTGAASPHVHPRIEPAALAPLLEDAGFVRPVVDVDRVAVSYPSFQRLIGDIRAMGASNVLESRPRFVGRAALRAAMQSFADAASGGRTVEIFEILHFAGWAPQAR